MRRRISWLTMLVLSPFDATPFAAEHVICATASEYCDYVGNRALQEAVDEAVNGDIIHVRPGVYVSEGFRDIPYTDIVVRAFVLVDGKDITISGETGAILDGSMGDRASAIVVSNGNVAITNLLIRDFRPDLTDDDLYDGHGVFVINGQARISSVIFERIGKMAVSVRGDSAVVLENAQLIDGHVGAWTEEIARLDVRNSVFRNNDSAGIAAYALSAVTVSGSTFEANLDDGVYGAENARIEVVDSRFVKNRPYAVRNVDNAQISIMTSRFEENAADRFPAPDRETTPQDEGS